MGHKKLCQALDKKNMRKIIEVLVGSFHLKICNQSLGFDLKGFHCISSLIRAFLESVKICFMPRVWKVGLWVLTSKGSVSRSVVGAGPQHSAAGILGPWDSGGVWLGSPGQAKIEHKESGRRTVGAGPLLFPLSHPSYCPCVIALNLEQHRNKHGSKTGLKLRSVILWNSWKQLVWLSI